MGDIVDRKTRSRMMSNIRGTHTRPEKLLRQRLHAYGVRFRLHGSELPGRPDVVIPRYRAAVFVHGCFWHQHPECYWATTPSSNSDFWVQKFEANQARDALNVAALARSGWKVAVVWECALHRTRLDETVAQLVKWLSTHRKRFETSVWRRRWSNNPRDLQMPTEMKEARVARTKLVVDLTDGRSIHVPIEHFPVLSEADARSRSQVQIGSDRRELRWKDLGLRILLTELLVDSGPASVSIAVRGRGVTIEPASRAPESRLEALLKEGKAKSDRYLTKGLFPRLTKAGRDKIQEMHDRGCAPQDISREVMVSIASVRKHLPKPRKKVGRNPLLSR